MAKKTVNVVYKIDDSELVKVKARIQETEKATKASEVAMTSFSKKASEGNVVLSNTIAGMTLQMQRLKAQIDLTNTADTARLNKLKADYALVKSKVDEFNKSLTDSTKAGESSINVFGSLQTAIATAFSVAAVKRLGDFVLEMNTLAGQIEGVDKGFKRAFPNATLLLDQLRKSTHGTITDFELMKRTLQATNLGVTAEHLGVLFEFAAARAQQTGESVDYLVDSIVRGVGRKSILVLDNLGLSATRLREQFGGAAIASKSVAEVTAGVAEIARVELQKMGGYVDTSETRVKQLDVAWQNLKQTVAKRVAGEGTTSFLTDITEGLRRAIASSEDLTKEFTSGKAIEAVNAFLATGKKTTEGIHAEIEARYIKIELLKREADALDKSTTSGRTRNDIINLNLASQKEAITLLRQYEAELAKGEPSKDQVGFIQSIKDAIEALNTEIDQASREQLPFLQSKLDSLQQQLKGAQLLRPLGSVGDVNKQNELRDLQFDENAEAQIMKDANDIKLENEKDFEKKLVDGEKDFQKTLTKSESDGAEERRDQSDRERARDLKQIEDDYNKKKRLQQQFQDFLFYSLDQILTATLINRQRDIQDVNAFYDAQIAAVQNSGKERTEEEKRKDDAIAKIEKNRANALEAQNAAQIEQDRADAITKIEIDTAVAVAKTLAHYGLTPEGAIAAGLVAAAGLVQILTVKSVKRNTLKTRAFSEGEIGIDGPGTTTSDSISARLSRGESVINAQATSQSRNLLEAINERRIDDRILNRIASDGGKQVTFDDKGIIEAIERNKVDYINQGYSLMKAEKMGSNFKRIIRSKVQGY